MGRCCFYRKGVTTWSKFARHIEYVLQISFVRYHVHTILDAKIIAYPISEGSLISSPFLSGGPSSSSVGACLYPHA